MCDCSTHEQGGVALLSKSSLCCSGGVTPNCCTKLHPKAPPVPSGSSCPSPAHPHPLLGLPFTQFLIKIPTFSLPCECQAVIPAPVPCSGKGREGGAQHSKLGQIWGPAREGECAEPPGGGKGWEGAARAPLLPLARVFAELQSLI